VNGVAEVDLEKSARSSHVHIGRQRILDSKGRLHGYELLFRSGASADEAGGDGDAATTATILAAFSEFGAKDLLGDRLGFINLTPAFIHGEMPLPFEPEAAVLEVLETVARDERTVESLNKLAAKGYSIALDDFVWTDDAAPLVALADVVKIDVLALPWDEVLRTMELCRPYSVQFLAEKIEDATMMRQCQDAGFELFQGYYLARPQTLTMDTLTPGVASSLQLLGKLSSPVVTPKEIEELVRRDPALTYRLLRIANSASSSRARKVSSIKDALIMVGLAKLRAWTLLLSMSGATGGDAGLDVVLTRAGTCERLAAQAGVVRPDSAFTIGLLDGLSEALNLSVAALLERLPTLDPDLAGALMGSKGPMRDLLDTVHAYENLDHMAMARLGITSSSIASCHLSALAWATDIRRLVSSGT
jgi:c-di-GMP-related signal transduction protein